MSNAHADAALRHLCRSLDGDQTRPRADWPTINASESLAAALVGHGLQNLVYAQLPSLPGVDRLKSRLKPAVLKQASVSLLQHRMLLDFSRVLGHLNAPFLLIKGTPLAYLYYPEPHLRPRGDIDILLPADGVEGAYDGLVRLGYPCEILVTPLYKAKYLTSQFVCMSADRSVHFDMHWQISNAACLAQILSFEELVGDAIAVSQLDASIRTPRIHHAFLIACIHWVAESSNRLIWLHDLHLLNKHMSGDDWQRLVSLAVRKKCATILTHCLDQTRFWFGTQFDPGILEQLRQRAAAGPRETTRFFAGGAGPLKARGIDFLCFDWRQRGQLLWTLLFPPYSYLQRQFPRSKKVTSLAYLRCFAQRAANVLLPASRRFR